MVKVLRSLADEVVDARELVLVHDSEDELILVVFAARVLRIECKFLVPFWVSSCSQQYTC